VTLAPSASQNAFCGEDTDPVALNANLSGDDGPGELIWSGNGVVNNNGAFTFDPTLAGVGSHTLTVRYTQETLCTYSETMTMMVNAAPAVAIIQETAATCAGNAGASRMPLRVGFGLLFPEACQMAAFPAPKTLGS